MNDLMKVRKMMTVRKRCRAPYDTGIDDLYDNIEREEDNIKGFLKKLESGKGGKFLDISKVLERYYWNGTKRKRYAKYLPQFMINCIEGQSEYRLKEILTSLNKKDLDMVMSSYIDNNGDNNQEFIDLYEKIKQCDNTLDNLEYISKRFDIDGLNKIDYPADVYCDKVCEYIDTYDIAMAAKISIALNCILSNTKYPIEFIPSLQERILVYFVSNSMCISDDAISDIREVLQNNIFIDSEGIDKYIHFINATEDDRFAKKRMNDINNYISNDDIKKCCTRLLKDCKTQKEYINTIEELLSYKYNDDNEDDILQVCKVIMSLPLINSKCNREFIKAMMNKCQDKYSDNIIFNDLATVIDDWKTNDDIIIDLSKRESVEEAIDFKAKANTIKTNTKEVKDKVLKSGVSQTIQSPNRTMAGSKDIKGLCDEFRMSQDKSPNMFRKLMQKIYTKQPEDIILGLPNIFGIIRVGFILSTATIPIIGPVIAVVAVIVDRLISMHMNEQNAKDLRAKLKEEKRKVQEKLDKKSDREKELTLYMEELDSGIKKVDDYLETITDDNEDDDMDTGFDFGDDDLFGEADNGYFNKEDSIYHECISLLLSMQLLEEVIELKESNNIDELIPTLSQQGVLKDMVSIMNETYIEESDKDILYDELMRYKGNDISYNERVDIMESLDSINKAKIHDDYLISLIYAHQAYSLYNNILTEAEDKKEGIKSKLSSKLNKVKDGKKDFKFNPSTMKLVLAKFRGNIRDLSTKEKSAAQTMDIHIGALINGIEKAMVNDRREAIIKGSIIPSFSKTIKSAIAIGGLSFINPVFGIIAGVGAFAMSKSLNAREKRLLFDEIDTELKVIEKEIQIAENDNDMKKYRFLLQTQRKLQRERNRIKYNIKATGKDLNVPTSSRKE